MDKILFILKKREITCAEHSTLSYDRYSVSTGLLNSATFVVDMLNHNGIEANIVIVNDNNDIDREVTKYRPTHVIIEAFWVVPEKFDVLTRLHPNVYWVIRNHSETPFLSNDSIAVEWSLKYIKNPKVFISSNSPNSYADMYRIVKNAYNEGTAWDKVRYLPNHYQFKEQRPRPIKYSDVIDVGCFGAVRPFKNHLLQAIAAVEYARQNKKDLNFHVNVARIEESGSAALKNLRSFFAGLPQHKLVEHGWLAHDDFLDLVCEMDFGLQVSFTESFNIVTADFVSQRIPIVVSKEVFWMPETNYADPTSTSNILDAIERVTSWSLFSKEKRALNALKKYNQKSVDVWLETFK